MSSMKLILIEDGEHSLQLCHNGVRGNLEEGFPEAGMWKRDSKKRLMGGCQEGHEVMVPEAFGSGPWLKNHLTMNYSPGHYLCLVITAMTMDAAEVNPGAPVA